MRCDHYKGRWASKGLSMCTLSTIRESRGLAPLMPATDGGDSSGGLLYVSAVLPEGKITP